MGLIMAHDADAMVLAIGSATTSIGNDLAVIVAAVQAAIAAGDPGAAEAALAKFDGPITALTAMASTADADAASVATLASVSAASAGTGPLPVGSSGNPDGTPAAPVDSSGSGLTVSPVEPAPADPVTDQPPADGSVPTA